MEFNSNQSNLSFDQAIDKSKDLFERKMIGTCGHSAEVLLNRLLQRVVEISLCPFSQSVVNQHKKIDQDIPLPNVKINSKRAFFDVGTGQITITPLQWCLNQFEFLFHWFFCFIAAISFKSETKYSVPFIVVMDVGEESLFVNGSDERFVTFCRNGPIAPLRNGKRFIIQSTSSATVRSAPHFTYAKRPLIYLLQSAKLGIWRRMVLLVNLCVIGLHYLYASVRLPQMSLLGRDIPYSGVSIELQRNQLMEAVVLTSSSYNSQPLWVRSLPPSKVHMVWYSNSIQLISWSCDKVQSSVPNYRWICPAVHWVWTKAAADYLGRVIPKAEFKIAGPITWHMPIITSPPTNEIRITLFDVPPFSHEYSLAELGVFPNYYIPENLQKFVGDVVALKYKIESVFQLPVSLQLKVKREERSWSSVTYNSYLRDLAASGVLTLIPYQENLYFLISGSHIVIVYPFSSPAYIAESLDVPAIYHDPTHSIVRHEFSNSPSSIQLTANQSELLQAVVSALSQVFKDTSDLTSRKVLQASA